jgi:hypothetical protein
MYLTGWLLWKKRYNASRRTVNPSAATDCNQPSAGSCNYLHDRPLLVNWRCPLWRIGRDISACRSLVASDRFGAGRSQNCMTGVAANVKFTTTCCLAPKWTSRNPPFATVRFRCLPVKAFPIWMSPSFESTQARDPRACVNGTVGCAAASGTIAPPQSRHRLLQPSL